MRNDLGICLRATSTQQQTLRYATVRAILHRVEPAELRRWIEQRKYTRDALAAELGVNRVTLYRWLNGSLVIPRTVELALKGLEAGKEKDRNR